METACKPRFGPFWLGVAALCVLGAVVAGVADVHAQASATVSGVTVSSIDSTTATATVTLTNPNSESTTVYLRYRTPAASGTWSSDITGTTSGTSLEFSLTGLTSGSGYRVEAALGSSYTNSQTADFTTLSPSVSAVSVASIGSTTATATVTIANPDSDTTTVYLRYRTPAASGTWSSDITGTASGTTLAFSLTGLTSGSGYRVEAALDSSYTGSQTADFTTLSPSVSAVSVSSISSTTATATVTIANPDSESTTVYLRYRPPAASWSSNITGTASGTTAEFSLTGLTPGTSYLVEAALNTGYTNSATADFDTLSASVSAVSVGSISSTTATATVTIAYPDSDTTTVYLRYRTPAVSRTWSSDITGTASGTTVEFGLTGLTPGSGYRVEAAFDSSYTSSQTADFTTLSPSVSAVSVGNISSTTATVTLTISDADGTLTTFYVRHRTPPGSGLWSSIATVSTSTSTATLDLSGLTSGRQHRVEAGASNAFTDSETADFTTSTDLLGRIVITVGRGSGSDDDLYGYDSGASFGTLDSGSFPGALFGDGNSRTVDEMYEDGDGYWYLTYSGGAASDWNSDQERLDRVDMEVTYGDGRDFRSFVLGGFTDGTLGTHGLRLDPPIPARDWDSRDRVTVEFRRHLTQATSLTLPGSIGQPTTQDGSFAELLAKTPGGPIGVQLMTTVMVFLAVLYAKWGKGGSKELVLTLLAVMVMTPWAPVVLFDQGSLMLSVGISSFMVAAGMGYRYFTRPVR